MFATARFSITAASSVCEGAEIKTGNTYLKRIAFYLTNPVHLVFQRHWLGALEFFRVQWTHEYVAVQNQSLEIVGV